MRGVLSRTRSFSSETVELLVEFLRNLLVDLAEHRINACLIFRKLFYKVVHFVIFGFLETQFAFFS